MTVIYQTTITRIGASATDALSDQMLITFREGAPADLEEYCFIHLPRRVERCTPSRFAIFARAASLSGDRTLAAWRKTTFANWVMSPCASMSLNEAEFPGTVHVAGPVPDDIAPGSVLKLWICYGVKNESGRRCHRWWANLRRVHCATVWLPRGVAPRLSIFRATKPQMWRENLTPGIWWKVWRTVLVLTPLASKAFWRSLVRVDGILWSRGFAGLQRPE